MTLEEKIKLAETIISIEVQFILANDEYWEVSAYLAENPNIISEVQFILANDEYWK